MGNMCDIAEKLLAELEERAAEHDRTGQFPFENYARLRELGYLAGPVPAELGGLDAGISETARAQRILGSGCASTALSVNMHLFQVGAAAGGWRASGANEPLLRRVVDEGLVLASTGAEAIVAGAWETSTTATLDGDDYVVTGRKYFCSQAPAMDIVRVNARDTATGEILVLAVPAGAPGVTVVETWDTTGMRATASHDVVLDAVRVPVGAVGARLPADGPAWHPAFAAAIRWFQCGLAGVYLGIADRARSLALASLGSAGNGAFREPALTDVLVGRLEATMLRAVAVFEVGVARAESELDVVAGMVQAVMTREETIAAAAEVVDLACRIVGASSFFRRSPLERLVRDMRAARFHPPADPVSFQMVGRFTASALAGG